MVYTPETPQARPGGYGSQIQIPSSVTSGSYKQPVQTMPTQTYANTGIGDDTGAGYGYGDIASAAKGIAYTASIFGNVFGNLGKAAAKIGSSIQQTIHPTDLNTIQEDYDKKVQDINANYDVAKSLKINAGSAGFSGTKSEMLRKLEEEKNARMYQATSNTMRENVPNVPFSKGYEEQVSQPISEKTLQSKKYDYIKKASDPSYTPAQRKMFNNLAVKAQLQLDKTIQSNVINTRKLEEKKIQQNQPAWWNKLTDQQKGNMLWYMQKNGGGIQQDSTGAKYFKNNTTKDANGDKALDAFVFASQYKSFPADQAAFSEIAKGLKISEDEYNQYINLGKPDEVQAAEMAHKAATRIGGLFDRDLGSYGRLATSAPMMGNLYDEAAKVGVDKAVDDNVASSLVENGLMLVYGSGTGVKNISNYLISKPAATFSRNINEIIDMTMGRESWSTKIAKDTIDYLEKQDAGIAEAGQHDSRIYWSNLAMNTAGSLIAAYGGATAMGAAAKVLSMPSLAETATVIPAGMFGASSYADTYNEMRRYGYDPISSLAVSAPTGVAIAAIENWSISRILSEPKLTMGLVSAVKRMNYIGMTEAVEEGSQQFIQNYVEKTFWNPEKDARDGIIMSMVMAYATAPLAFMMAGGATDNYQAGQIKMYRGQFIEQAKAAGIDASQAEIMADNFISTTEENLKKFSQSFKRTLYEGVKVYQEENTDVGTMVTQDVDNKIVSQTVNAVKTLNKAKTMEEAQQALPLIYQANQSEQGKKIVSEASQELKVDIPKGNTVQEMEEAVKEKYKTIHEGGDIKMVEGTPVKIVDGIDTFLNKDENGNWVVSEATTGRSLTNGGYTNSNFAIKAAKENILSVGEDKFKELISNKKLPSTDLPQSLLDEARKYKSAEEFKQNIGPAFKDFVTAENNGEEIINPELYKVYKDVEKYKEAGGKDMKLVDIWNKAQEKVETPAPTAPEVPVKTTQKVEPKTDISKVAQSVSAKAVEKKLIDSGITELAGYTKKSVKDQTVKIEQFLEGDINKARAVLNGASELPGDINLGMFLSYADELANKTGDIDLIMDIARSNLTSETSSAAQTLRFLQEREQDSASVRIKEVMDSRKKSYESKKGKNISKDKASVKNELKRVVSKNNLKPKDWESFVDSIRCK